MKKNFRAGVAATGMVLPKNCYTNDDIIAEINKATAGRTDVPELNSAWIEENIWIKTRHHFTKEESLIDASVDAVQQALARAGWDAADLDFVILSSVSCHSDENSMVIPSMACQIQEKLEAFNAFAYDTSAACSGWVYGMAQATAFVESGMAKRGVVICSEKQRQGLNFSDHRSSVLIGDVATATLLERTESVKTRSVYLKANDSRKQSDMIRLPYFRELEAGGLNTGYFSLQGKRVFKEGIMSMCRLTKETLVQNEMTVDDVDWFIYHQANGAMLRQVGRKIGMKDERNLMNIQQLANTTAGTIPSVLHMHIEDGTIKRGDTVCCIAFGGGLTAGSMLFEF